jgi:hypothetical protein
MKKSLLTASLALLAWAAGEQRAAAWTKVDIGCGFHFCVETTGRNRCWSYTSVSNPPPCGYACGPYGGPNLWDSMGAYGAGLGGGYAVAVPAGSPATTTPTTPTLPAPTPAPSPAPMPSGPQRTGFYTTAGTTYGSAGAYGYGYSYGGYQAPSYWYDR